MGMEISSAITTKDYTVLIAIIGTFQAIMIAVITGYFHKDAKMHRKTQAEAKKLHDDMQARAILRAEESKLAMKLMYSCVDLGIATAVAVREGKANGQITHAVERAVEVENEYREFVHNVAAVNIMAAN
jgi:hypothetical protein